MLTFQDQWTKAQRLARDNTPGTLAQLQQDINTAYHLFNAKMTRYFSRKQKFTNLIAGQNIYQTPVDNIRISGMTVLVSSTYQPPIKEIRSEYQWRQMTAYPIQSNWPTFYFTIGANQFGLWPTPSQSVTNGLRLYYQMQDHDLTLMDVTSVTTGYTVSVTQGSTTVTATGAAFNSGMIGMQFQIQGIADVTWYEISAVPTTNTLILESAYVGSTASGLAWRVGQVMIFPQEYQDAPVHYALSLYFSSKGNENRSTYHFNMYNGALLDAIQQYSSANESAVIDDTEPNFNLWLVDPLPGQNN